MNEKINEIFYNDPRYSSIIIKSLLEFIKIKDPILFDDFHKKTIDLFSTDSHEIGENHKELMINLNEFLKNI